jgi:CheY-like chemotaxis protein
MSEEFYPSKFSVLVVDDEIALADIITEEFIEEGYIVHTAYSGTQGMKMLDEHKIDLVLTDIIMPGATGIELVGYGKANHPDVKIYFVMTGFIDHSKSEILAMGVDRYFTKPLLMEDVLEFAKQALI